MLKHQAQDRFCGKNLVLKHQAQDRFCGKNLVLKHQAQDRFAALDLFCAPRFSAVKKGRQP